MGIKRLKHSLALTFVFIAIVPIILVSLLVLNHLSRDTIKEIQNKNLLLSKAMRGQVEGFLREPHVVLQNVGAMLKAIPDYSERIHIYFR
jgi:hypothetical protein